MSLRVLATQYEGCSKKKKPREVQKNLLRWTQLKPRDLWNNSRSSINGHLPHNGHFSSLAKNFRRSREICHCFNLNYGHLSILASNRCRKGSTVLSSYSSGWTTRPQKSNFVSLVASCPDRRNRKILILTFLFPFFFRLLRRSFRRSRRWWRLSWRSSSCIVKEKLNSYMETREYLPMACCVMSNKITKDCRRK